MAQQTDQLMATVEGAAIRPTAPIIDGLRRSKLSSAPGFWRRAWRRYRQNSVSVAALAMVVLIILFILSADLLSRYVTHFTFTENHLAEKLTPPFTGDYILGADGNGRDVLTRLAYGGRISLMIAVLATASILVIGGTIGAAAGYFGGIIDSIAMRLADVLLSIPSLVLLIVLSSFYQPSPLVLALFIALLSWAGIARLIRAEVLSLKNRDYIDAARVIGSSNSRILLKHLFPNVIPIIVVWASIVVPALILTEAALSYLGLGVRTPTPSWGNMLQDAKQFLRQSWTLIFIPGFAIYITVLSINLVGTGLRDALDPRLNQ
ncbi:MAG: ABC transporter permease [Thermomicrobiales bacterium]